MSELQRMEAFLKEEAGNSQAIVEIDAKKSLATLLATSTILSPSYYKNLFASENYTKLESKTLIENLSTSNKINSSYFYDASTWVIGRENFFYLRYPLIDNRTNNKDEWGSPSINKRSELYILKKPNPYNFIPQYIGNGNESNAKYDSVNVTYQSVNKALSEALKNQKQMASFSIKENKEVSQFELKVEALDPKLIANRNINLVVISYLDYANNTSPDKLQKGYDQPDFIYHNVVRELPFDSEGKKIMFKRDGILEEKFYLKTLNSKNRQQSGFVVFIQDMSTKQILATGVCRLANLDGIDKPMYLNWNNHTENVFDEYYKNEENAKKIINWTGLQEMTLNVKDIPTNTDLKKIGIEIGKSGDRPGYTDSEYFDILGYSIPLSLQKNIQYLSFDPDTSRLELEFINPITHLDPETPIFTYIAHFKQKTAGNGTFNFQAKNLQIFDSNNWIPYFYLNNPKLWHRNQLGIRINPLDFNKNTWINEEDLSELIPQFGTNENEENWDPIYDIHQGGISKGRIDIGDIRTMINEVNRQNRFKEIIKEQNPYAELDSVDPSIIAEVHAQLRRLFPALEGSSQRYYLKAL